MPNKGQYLEFSFEQGWGTFTYPKVEVEGRTYFTTGSRPDGSGKRILTLRGHFGVTGRDTPVYERFFAGYFGSLRGFQYRGVGPHVLGVNVGGIMMALGSVEYMFPLDRQRQVPPGRLLRLRHGRRRTTTSTTSAPRSAPASALILPPFGPLPLSFDLAFPVVKAPGDRIQIFNFPIGAMY